MIIIDNMQIGRFGNQVLFYNNLRQLANICQTEFGNNSWPGIEFFDLPVGYPKDLKIPYAIMDSTFGIEEYQLVSKELDIVLRMPCLGEMFFDVTREDPNNFLKFKEEYEVEIDSNFYNIGIHFRGSDFYHWNPIACLPTKYYIDSIEYCILEFKKEKPIKFLLFTEDLAYQPFLETKHILEDQNINFCLGPATQAPNKNFIYDFNLLSKCDTIISSPSTFAISASLLGKKNKKVIHSKKWIDYSCERDDKLWVDLNNGGNNFYKLWRTV